MYFRKHQRSNTYSIICPRQGVDLINPSEINAFIVNK